MTAPTRKEINKARRLLVAAIYAAHARRDEYDHPEPAKRQLKEDRAALKLLVDEIGRLQALVPKAATLLRREVRTMAAENDALRALLQEAE